MFGSLMMLASGVLASAPSSARASGMRWSSSRYSGKPAMMRPASEMSRVSTATPACGGVRLDHGQERVRRQRRRLVGVGVDDGRVSHRVLRSTSATLLDIKISPLAPVPRTGPPRGRDAPRGGPGRSRRASRMRDGPSGPPHGGSPHTRRDNCGVPPHGSVTWPFLRCGDTETSPSPRPEVVTMATPAPAPTAPGSLRRIVAASLIGTTIEWYDFFLYGSAAALVFNKLFFPDTDPLVGTLLSFLTYAVGFAARPVGALVFGHYGDRLGRKRLLVLSLLLMGGATFCIGLLPDARARSGSRRRCCSPCSAWCRASRSAASGAARCCWSPSTATRGGAGSGRPGRRRARRPANCSATGVLSALTALISDAAFTSWGWRIPFLLSGVLVWWGCGSGCRSTSRRCSRPRWPGRRPARRRRPRSSGCRCSPCCATTGGTSWSPWAPAWRRTSATTSSPPSSWSTPPHRRRWTSRRP